jgi:phosphoinositide-3-kinase regulatory subunit 4
VRDAMSAALSAGMPGGGGARGAACHAPWYPRGVLVAHLAEHRRAVTRLAAAPASPFLASASADGSVKVWDCRRLDRDVSFRSRLTYAAHGQRVEALAASSDGHTVASGCAAGAIHVWRVEVAARAGGAPERYTGIVGCSQVCGWVEGPQATWTVGCRAPLLGS